MYLALDEYSAITEGAESYTSIEAQNTPTGIYDKVSYFDIRGIRPDKLDEMYKIEVTDKENQTVILTVEYSPFTYLSSKLHATAEAGKEDELLKLQQVATAMYRYNEAAEAYVESTSTN